MNLIKDHKAGFGFFDDKGRECGFRYRVHEDASQEQSERFVVWGSPTRAGKEFGPSFNIARFATEALALAYAEKRVEDCRARYWKKFRPTA